MEALSTRPFIPSGVEGLLAALAFATLTSCSASTLPLCGDGTDRGLMSTGTCGPAATVTVKSGSTCVPSAFTGFNSELAGFPQATNDDHPVEAAIAVADGGTETRRCTLKAAGDSGFTVNCDLCASGATDAGCTKVGSCTATLLP